MGLALIVLLIVLGGFYGWYAVIVARRNKVAEALGGIDAQLQQRHDLIPNVLAVARRFMAHERELIEEITRLRGAAAPRIGSRDFALIDEKFRDEARLGADLGRFFAVAESYPDLTSAAPMVEAQRAYREVEANIAASRRFYNSAVAELRNAVQIFPGGLLAGAAGISTLPPFFAGEEAARGPVNAADHL